MADTTLNKRIAALAKKLGVSPLDLKNDLVGQMSVVKKEFGDGYEPTSNIDLANEIGKSLQARGPEYYKLFRDHYDAENPNKPFSRVIEPFNMLLSEMADRGLESDAKEKYANPFGYEEDPNGEGFSVPSDRNEAFIEDFEEETGEAASPERPKPTPQKTLDQPKGAAAQVEEGPNLDNPAGLAAMADNLGRGVRDPRIKSIAANQRRNMEKSLNAQAARKIDEDIAKQRRADRTQKIFDDRDADLKEAWARSRTGRRTGLTFDELDADTQAEMRNRYNDSREAGAYSDEKWDDYKQSLGVPVYDENGLVGYESSKKFEEDMGGQQIRMNPDQPNRAQIRERRNNAMLDDIRSEIKETGKHPFGEGPILGTDHAREVELSKKFGGDMAGLKKAARDVRDNPFNKANYAEAFMPADFNQPKPLPPTSSPVSSFEPSQKMVSQDMLDRNNQEVNSVLDAVPFPRPKSPQAPKPKPRNPITTLPFSLEQPVSKESGVELTRTSKEYPTMDVPKYPANSEPSVDLTRTTKEYPTMDAPDAQYRKQSSSFGRSGKKQYNISALDRLDPDNYDYRPDAPKHPGGAGMGRSGKKQYNLDFLNFLDPDNYFYNQ